LPEPFPVVSFLSDYGTSDEFVGVCKGVMLGIAPQITILDITHEVPAFDVRAGGLTLSRAVQYLKGKSSHKLLTEHQSLRKRYWGQHLWSRGYWVATSGNVTDEVWKKYIEDQKPEEPDDNVKVV